jgi:nicotinamidase-related amidase
MRATPPGREALVVVDVQCGLFDGPDGAVDAAGTLGRINTLIGKARAAGRPVIFIQHDEPPDLVPDTPAWALHPSLDRRPTDPVIRKTTCDAFCRTSLDEELRGRAVTTLFVAGYATEFCIDSTVRAAASRGYHVVVVGDAHTTQDRPPLPAAQIIALFHWVWPNLAADPPVAVRDARSVHFEG